MNQNVLLNKKTNKNHLKMILFLPIGSRNKALPLYFCPKLCKLIDINMFALLVSTVVNQLSLGTTYYKAIADIHLKFT